MRFRKLRIAWSVAWGVVAVLSVLLWIRGNWYNDGWSRQSGSERVYVESVMGILKWGSMPPYYGQDHPWQWGSRKALYNHGELGFPFPAYRKTALFYTYVLPYWFTTAIVLILGGLPWLQYIPWRFSLRTLLIATTLVAGVLGLAVY